jgi:hypothetical protein
MRLLQKTGFTSNRWPPALLIATTAIFMISCLRKSPEIVPPFFPYGVIESQKQLNIVTEPAGMTGHQQIFILWDLKGETDKIKYMTSDSNIVDRLYWFAGSSERLKNCLSYFEPFEEYGQIRPFILEMLKDPDVRFGYQDLNILNDDIAFETIWVCSPKLKRLAYLSGS